jgi:hypothetical protein
MTTLLKCVLCSVFVSVATAGCLSDEDDGEGGATFSGALGAPCGETLGCDPGLQCGREFYDDYNPVEGQCTMFCDSSEQCKTRFGEFSYCIGANKCVLECARDEECPAHTACDSGFCRR